MSQHLACARAKRGDGVLSRRVRPGDVVMLDVEDGAVVVDAVSGSDAAIA